MTTYDLGEGVNLRYLAKDRDGNPVAATVAMAITRPDGTVDNVAVTTATLGQYDAATYVPPAIGDYQWQWTVSGAVVDEVTGHFTVANPSLPVYADFTAVKAQIGKITSDDRDANISLAIVAASRMIDAACGKWPGAFQPARTASTRTFPLQDRIYTPPQRYSGGGYFSPLPGGGYLRSRVTVDDISDSTGVTVSIGAYSTGTYSPITAYTLGPDNAIALGQPIEYITAASSIFSGIDSIQVTAKWGWPAVPSQVEMATRLLAARLYRRKDSPQGVIVSADWGAARVSRTDPDVFALIQDLSVPGFA